MKSRRRVDLFQHDGPAGTDQPQVGGHLLLAATERGELEAGVHQVEPGGLQLAGEQELRSYKWSMFPFDRFLEFAPLAAMTTAAGTLVALHPPMVS